MLQRLVGPRWLLVATTLSIALQVLPTQGQQDFTTAQIPNPFGVGDFYPPRPEVEVCRPIRDYIDRNSARFTNELVTNTNADIVFSTSDSRIMSSRMQSRLNSLASLYRQQTGRRMTVLRAWTQFYNRQVNDNTSLHYEGRTVQVRLPSGSNYNQFLQLAVQAAFDWVYYQQSTLVRLSVIPTNCDRNVDCVFILDQSGSVGRTNHGIAIQFIQNIVAFFNIGLNQTRVGFVAYSRSAHLEFDLNDYTTLTSLITGIGNVNYRGGSTRTGSALNLASNILNPTLNYGARPDDGGVPKIVVLITDGRSHDGVITPSNRLKDAGVIVYAVGIGNIDVDELRDISSDPDDEHVFLLSSFRDAAGFVDFLSVTTCETPAIINPDGNVTTTVPPGGLEYFRTECPTYTDRVLIELTDLNGTNFLYASATEDNPGPLTGNTIRNETLGVTRRTLTLNIPSGSNVVFIGVQGQAEQNAFTIIVWDQLFSPSDVSVDILEGGSGQMEIYDFVQNLVSRARGISLRYSIIEGNEDRLFNIQNGRVFVMDVARLTPSVHNLTVLAQHTYINCQRSRTRISVRVLSNRITFGSANPVTIFENATINTPVATISASGGRGPIQFSIGNGNTGNKFRIHSSTGVITLVRTLDYETTQTYNLVIRAQTSVGGTVTGTIQQRVNVGDVNEVPTFDTACARSGSCAFTISEGLSMNTFVDTIRASDPDLPTVPNGMLGYVLRSQLQSLPFLVSQQGRISITEPLDRETRDMYVMTLSVSDSTVTIQTTVVVNVNDIDDNPPRFIQAPSNIQIQENLGIDSEIAQYIATDDDIGANAAINYVITAGNSRLPFQIDAQTGVLRVNDSIDYEMQQSYTITVTARNPNNLSSAVSQTTTIRILNLNDNRPQFSQNSYTLNLQENTPANVQVVTVEATDADLGTFGDVTYSITEGNFQTSFRINSLSGAILTSNPIDREVISSFSLRVEARDGGGRRRIATVDITIIDVNDNSPIFVGAPYQVQVREDVSVPFDVLQVTATDADEPGNPNSQITYRITGGNSEGVFAINSSTGQIRTAQTLDFEATSSYTLDIEAADGGTPSNSTTTTAIINVINVNENPPSLSGDQSVNISESASMGSIVASYTALDPDMNTVTFRIISGNEEGKFAIGNMSGMITLESTLNYEVRSSYNLTIEASDGLNSANAILTITVLDENEFAPVFQGGTTFSVEEERPDGTLVGTIQATDADGDPMNNQVTYSFVQSSNYFTIGRTSGEIRTRGVLDREMLTHVFTPALNLGVTARDSASPSRQTTTSITITLVDINDNPPIFADNMYSNSLLENLPSGQTVFQVSATDIDQGSNAQISYSFVLNEHTEDTSLFMIDSDTGLLSTTGTLDCERQTSYSFTITATDGGTPQRMSTVQGILTVLDENDNAPIFSMNPYTISVFENNPIDSVLLNISASDRDKGQNGQIIYSVINIGGLQTSVEGQGDEFTLFAINNLTGVLSHRTTFDYERAAQVNVTVIAEDRGVPRRTSQATVVINVLNVDETGPIFTSTLCPGNIFVVEEVPLNSVISRCMAEDPDNVTTSSNEAAITYRISSGNEGGVFAINDMTGDIRNVGRLDRESRQSYTLVVIAVDSVGQSATRQVNIGLRDVNDNAPQFRQSSYAYAFINERIQRYTQQIIGVTATDRDNGNNGTIRYSLGQQVERNDREMDITVIASDVGTPKQSSNTTLTVTFERRCLLQEYEIDPQSGQVTAFVLCGVEVRPNSLNVGLASSERVNFSCSVLHNSRMSYQWVHNGSLITLPTFFQERSTYPVNYTITSARFDHAGEYACKATTRAGSLQTASSSVKIQIAPIITNPPENAVVKVGETATFRCVGSGIPTPMVRWYDEFGNLITNGTTLTRENVQATGRNPTFICIVSSDAGRAEKIVMLTVYDEKDVLEIDVNNLNNPIPSGDGGCQFVNKTQIEEILQSTTKRGVSVTRLQGENICEQTSCLPNPCQNGGVCSLSDTEQLGYECACERGYIGSNCNEDRNECTDDPCFNGTCTNTDGGFQCQCSSTSTGHLCQYSTNCQDPNTCSDGTVCVSTLDQSYTCRTPPALGQSVVITGNLTQDNLGVLSDLIQAEVERYLAARANAPSKRRKRQSDGTSSTLATPCEPRFIQPNNTIKQFSLIWLCPMNITEPAPQDQAVLCGVLLQSPLIATCRPPGGSETTLPTVPPPKETSVKISIVLVDNSGKPIDALDSEKELEESGSLEMLKQATGLEIASVSPLNSDPRQQQTQEGPPIGIVVGVIVGTILAIVLVAAVVIAVLMFVRRRRDAEERKQQQRRAAIQMLEKEELRASQDKINGAGGGDDGGGVEAVFTSSVDNLLQSEKSTEESAYDTLRPEIKVEENTYDSLQPQKKVQENDYDVLPRKVDAERV